MSIPPFAAEERARFERKSLEVQPLEGLEVIAGGIAHDLNNLLAVVLGHASLALSEVAPGTVAFDSVTEIERAARRAAELTGQLLAYASENQLQLEALDLAKMVEPRASPRRQRHGAGLILVVDDEKNVRLTTEIMLRQVGLTVLSAANGREAVEQLKANLDDIDCVLLDLTMPDMDGPQVLDELRKVRPDLPVVLTSGYSEYEVAQRLAGRQLSGFLQKPFQLSDLTRLLGTGPFAASTRTSWNP